MAQKKEHVQTHYLVTENYLLTRGAALHFPAKQFSGMISDEHSVYGVVIDMPIDPRTLSTLVVYINGAANLYFNNGGSYTGASQRYQTVGQADCWWQMHPASWAKQQRPLLSHCPPLSPTTSIC